MSAFDPKRTFVGDVPCHLSALYVTLGDRRNVLAIIDFGVVIAGIRYAAARVYHTCRRRDGELAARGTRAGGEDADHRIDGLGHVGGTKPMDLCLLGSTA